MIFKHLFRSKHQNPDPQVRIQAIENLNKQDPQQKSVLHELAFNDADVGVSLAALQKLDSFVLWYKMSQIAKNDRVQKKSQQFVENSLLDGQNKAL
ncbi:MAG: exonuclease SbcC, partial [Flavobacteriales bacterium]